MATIQNYAGVVWDVYRGDSDGTNFVQIKGVTATEPDNSSDDVTRNAVDGDNLSIQTNFSSVMNLTITDLGQDNLSAIIPDYTYEQGDSVDGADGVTVGEGGAVSIGIPKGSAMQVAGVLKFVPRLAAQSNHTFYMLGAESKLTDYTMDDNLLEFVVSVTGKAVKGDLVFDQSS